MGDVIQDGFLEKGGQVTYAFADAAQTSEEGGLAVGKQDLVEMAEANAAGSKY